MLRSTLANLQTSRFRAKVGEGARVARLAFPDQRQLVLAPGLQVAVQGVVDDVGLAADEPLVEGRVASRPAPCPTSGTIPAPRRAQPRIPAGW